MLAQEEKRSGALAKFQAGCQHQDFGARLDQCLPSLPEEGQRKGRKEGLRRLGQFRIAKSVCMVSLHPCMLLGFVLLESVIVILQPVTFARP